MDTAFAWCGFLGAWLLVAGPVYQAALELREQDFHRADIESAIKDVPRPEPVSAWWWLLPPVRVWAQHRRSQDYRAAAMRVLSPRDVAGLVDFGNKATAWLLVGTGGLLIALKETWELVERYEWPRWSFGVAAPAAALVALGYTVARIGRGEDMKARSRVSA